MLMAVIVVLVTITRSVIAVVATGPMVAVAVPHVPAVLHSVTHVFAVLLHPIPHLFAVPAAGMPIPTPVASEDTAVPTAVASDPAAAVPEKPIAAVGTIVKRLVYPHAVNEDGLAKTRIAALVGVHVGESGMAARSGTDTVGTVDTGHTNADADADTGRSRGRPDEGTAKRRSTERQRRDGKVT